MFALAALAVVVRSPPPHIVYFLVDDLGNANVGFHNDEPLTPVIDTLAAEGARLDRFYVYRFCSPTRSSFLSGRLPYHVNQINHPPYEAGGGVPPEMSTIADMLNRAKPTPYRSHQIGKWHGGMSRTEQLPIHRGFNSSFGYLSGAEDHFDQTRAGFADFWRDAGPAVGETGASREQCINATGIEGACRYATYQYTAEALRIIGAHPDPATTPLFLYFAFGNMHGPLQAPQSFIDLYPNVSYLPRRMALAQISIVDEAIGNVTAALKARGMFDNTLLLFSSDNGGPADHANNYPYRGAKGCDLEGGVRAVAFVGGGFLPAAQHGATVSGMLHIADLYATFAALAGVDPTDKKCAASRLGAACPPLDSLDMWPLLAGVNGTSPRTELMLASPNDASGVHLTGSALIGEGGRFKLVRGTQTGFFPGPHMPNSTNTGSGVKLDCRPAGGCLFDLISDPTEHVDLGTDPAYAAVKARLVARAAALDATQFQSAGSSAHDKAADAQAKANGGFWGPWQPNTPFPTPPPTVPPTPPPPTPPTPAPAGSFELRWLNGSASCLAAVRLEKAGIVALAPCAGSSGTWTADGDGRLINAAASTKNWGYLRQSPHDNCTAGNTAQLGVDGHGGLFTRYDAPNLRLVLASCAGLCLGVGSGGGSGGAVELVPCSSADQAQHWVKV